MDGAVWVLSIWITGGFTGAGGGSYVVTSAGQVSCTAPARCVSRLSEARLRELTALVAAASTIEWKVEAPGRCADCFRVRIEMSRRDQRQQRTSRAEWDEPLATTPEVARLYRAVILAADPQ